MSDTPYKYCDKELVRSYARRFNIASGWPDEVIDSFIMQSEQAVKNMLLGAYPIIADGTSWTNPSNTPEQIEHLTAKYAASLMRYDVLVNTSAEPDFFEVMAEVLNGLYDLRGEGRRPMDKRNPVPLYDRDGEIVPITQVSATISTSSEDSVISMNVYSDAKNGVVTETGTLNEWSEGIY